MEERIFIMLDRNKGIEYFGILAVVISVLFVGFEIRQANRIAIGTTSHEIQRNFMAINELVLADKEVAALLLKLRHPDVELTEVETVQAGAWARRMINNWTAIEEAYESGLLSESVYLSAVDDVNAFIKRNPGLLPIYRHFFAEYGQKREYDLLKPLEAASSN